MSTLNDFVVYIQGLIHHNLQLRQILQPILSWMHHVTLENIQLHREIQNLHLAIEVQFSKVKSLQEENVSLRRSFSTATIELEQLHLKYSNSRGPRDDIDSEAETVIL